MQLFVALRKIMKDLIEFRQQLLNGTLTKVYLYHSIRTPRNYLLYVNDAIVCWVEL